MQTKYGMVKQAIKSKILDGTYQPHQKINSESELMKQFDVSRHTVRVAIGELVNQGWLYRKQGSGTYCADRLKENNGQLIKNQKNIAIVTTYISDYIFPSIIRGAESYLSENGYHVTLFSTDNDHNKEQQVLEHILTQHFEGVIIEPTKSATSNPNINYYLNLERQGIPYIMINASYDELEPISITIDDEKGALLQTEHLIELGHDNIIGYFKNDDRQGSKRIKGYLKAHRKNGIKLNPNNMITYKTEDKYCETKKALAHLLELPIKERPTAIACYNDELAIALLDVLREKNIRVPEDFSIIGFDNSFLTKVSEVKLTSIEHPKGKLGEAAGKMILDIINYSKNKTQTSEDAFESIVFEPELVIRNSTGHPKASDVLS